MHSYNLYWCLCLGETGTRNDRDFQEVSVGLDLKDLRSPLLFQLELDVSPCLRLEVSLYGFCELLVVPLCLMEAARITVSI